MKYNVSEKAVASRDGVNYNLNNYVKGVDFVERRCFKTFKNMFRNDILGVSCVDPSVVEHKQEPNAVLVLDEKGLRIEFKPSAQKPKEEPSSEPTGLAGASPFDGLIPEHCEVQECKIKKIYPNFKWVETDKGRVWAGLKGKSLRVNQVILVKNGELFLGKIAPSSTMVRV